MTETNGKIKYMVADTTAFINAVPLNEYAENVLTVPDVVAEVRNKRQIRRLCVLPFGMEVREPRPESIKHCVEFAKKTGDYASLSGIDLKVIALSYELEKDNVGTEHLRTEPVMAQTIASKEEPKEMQEANNKRLVGWFMPDGEEDEEDEDDDDDEMDDDEDDNEEVEDTSVDNVKAAIEAQIEGIELPTTNTETKMDDISEEDLKTLLEELSCESDVPECDQLLVQTNTEDDEMEQEPEQPCSSKSNSNLDDDVGDDGWITHSNIRSAKKALEGKVESDAVPLVACMTTDYAIQNVLKQMNLNLAALNGRIIKQLRTYILRCYACFKTTSIMTKVFCPNCGNKTLKRVAVSLDENGKQVIHINTRRPLTSKYKNQSLPKFQGGKHSRNPILFEDQPMPRQMPSRVAKTKTNALNEDYVAGYSPFVLRDVDSKSAMLRSKGNLKEWARNNNFEEDRRRKHYNRLYK
ncbi:RNA-binding protein NOB1 [Drosophila obscura]|uniref:RNA-binding protein NOB1 n=1 Tax=Drosophila obscura TaxID=7282 RepID=UPI001BB1EB5F|nr:RNA-binding protein NOB1 [Drosophila obscura]